MLAAILEVQPRRGYGDAALVATLHTLAVHGIYKRDLYEADAVHALLPQAVLRQRLRLLGVTTRSFYEAVLP